MLTSRGKKEKIFQKKLKLKVAHIIVYTLLISCSVFEMSQIRFEKETQKVVESVNQETQSLKEELKTKEDTIEQKENEIIAKIAENKELSKKISEYEEDNVSLENTLKQVSSQGVKPNNYSSTPVVTSGSVEKKGDYLGKWEGTFYTPSAEECGNNHGITASGKPISAGYTIAADTSKWPIGTKLYIKGLGEVEVQDTGGAIKGKNRFDFAVFDKNIAQKLGTGEYEVYSMIY